MTLTEDTPVPSASLPVQEFKDHLRLATGFADTNTPDSYLEDLLRSALSAVEGRTGKAILTRDFRWSVTCWRDGGAQALPVAPVSAIVSVSVMDRDDNESLIASDRYWLEKDAQRPRLRASGSALPAIPTGGSAEVVLTAGFGLVWGDVPPDLRQAVLMIAASYFERRHEEGAEPSAMPFGVMALLERWRTVRSFGGGRS